METRSSYLLQLLTSFVLAVVITAAFFLMSYQPARAEDRREPLDIEYVKSLLDQLLERAGKLQNKITIDASPIGVQPIACPANVKFSRNLTVGSRGADVTALQRILNANPATQVAKTSYGSPGQETDYFGPATASAVARFQNGYKSAILTPNGLTNGSGYVGDSTRTVMNGICQGTAPGPDTNWPTPSPNTPPDVSGLPGFKTLTLTASPTSIKSGESSTITWNAPEAGSCTGFGKTLSNRGTQTVSPTKTTTYKVTCTGGELGSLNKIGSEVSEAVTVTVTGSDTNDPPIDPAPSQSVIIERNNIYSPEPVVINGATYLYFGGWADSGQVNDSIYRVVCDDDGTSCKSLEKVIDTAKLGFEHFNDPSIVRIPGNRDYFVMYMTGVVKGENGFIPTNNDIYYATSWADDGVNWSVPKKLVDNHWLPSVTLNARGEVELYANDNGIHGNVTRINLGKSGIAVGTATKVNYGDARGTDTLYANVYVLYQSGTYYILAERMNAPKAIDAFTSSDGINWTLTKSQIVIPAAGQNHIGTPAFNPNDHRRIYFGSTDRTDTTALKVRTVKLSSDPF